MPLCVGVPVMTPFVPSVSPAGSVPPARVHDVTVAPVAVRPGDVYAWLRFASGSAAVVTLTTGLGGAPPLTLIVYCWSEALLSPQLYVTVM